MEIDNIILEQQITNVLKTIYDPEIPVNIYEIGLIYEINIDKKNRVEIVMTLTSPNCPVADDILIEINEKVKNISGVKKVNVKLTFEPPWDKNMMTEEAMLELGLL